MGKHKHYELVAIIKVEALGREDAEDCLKTYFTRTEQYCHSGAQVLKGTPRELLKKKVIKQLINQEGD